METIKLFLIDDHKIVREGIKLMLVKNKNIMVVGEASNSDELFNFLENTKPNILLLDIEMPKLNGFEITKIVKAYYPDINIIMLSVNNSIEHVRQSIKLGASGYLSKQAKQNELLEAINLVFQGKKYIDKNISGFVDALNIA